MPLSRGNLFTHDFLNHAIRETPEYRSLDDGVIDALTSDLQRIFAVFPRDQGLSETQAGDDLISPVLGRLGWTAVLLQQNLGGRGRGACPSRNVCSDYLLFENEGVKAEATAYLEERRRTGLALAFLQSKPWNRALDRGTCARSGMEAPSAPSSQMLRSLRRVEDLTGGALLWGILTNASRWRLYFQGARSVSGDFFEIDLAAILGIDNAAPPIEEEARRHFMRLFVTLFRREAFVPDGPAGATLHGRALELGRIAEERVAASLSAQVCDRVFPMLATALGDTAPQADLIEIRDASLVLLYRLLFLLSAEDRCPLAVSYACDEGSSLLARLRADVGLASDREEVFSTAEFRYWAIIDRLTRAIARTAASISKGNATFANSDPSTAFATLNSALFDTDRAPLLTKLRINDAVMAEVIDALSFERAEGNRRAINYRDLPVQKLGSIYERLLELELVREDQQLNVRINAFARKASGSFYTPDDLARLIVKQTLQPLITERADAFRQQAGELAHDPRAGEQRLDLLQRSDPATQLLNLRICDPAMGSGHFLVTLLDHLTDQVITAMAEAEAMVDWIDYVSPLALRIIDARAALHDHATRHGLKIDIEQLDDRAIIRQMVLARCVYGVDKDPKAVELARLALWLHSLTAGVALAFLDHHLRVGDALFGAWVSGTKAAVTRRGGQPMLLQHAVHEAMGAAALARGMEEQTGVQLAEPGNSARLFASVKAKTAPLDRFMVTLQAINGLGLREKADRLAVAAWLNGAFGDAVAIAQGQLSVPIEREHGPGFAGILASARILADEQGFLNWQLAFPCVWDDWEAEALSGGFDAVIGNPPWDRMKLQQVEWFASRRPEIARATRAADRARMIKEAETIRDPLARDFAFAAARAETAIRVIRKSGDYPLLSGGDVNIYSLFVERAMTITRREGMVGLLTPSGIASDKTAARFFREIATNGRLKALIDFENRRSRFGKAPFFPGVDSRFKFNALIASPGRVFPAATCAFFVQDVSELSNPERCFPLSLEDFALLNPNTGTAPVFRTRRDARLTAAIYRRLPVLVDRSSDQPLSAWPVRYARMFDMTNDSGLFRNRAELEEKERAWRISGNCWQSPEGEWVPLYEGKMVQAFDHRAASIIVNPENLNRPAQPVPATAGQHADPLWCAEPQYWVARSRCGVTADLPWALAFKDITAPTNARTFIAAALPSYGFGNKLPLLVPTREDTPLALLLANLNAIVFDFVVRQKIQGQTLNRFIVEQLPVVPPDAYDIRRFGPKTATEIVTDAVLELTYTADDMAPFARELGYVDAHGEKKLPFRWNQERRLMLRAKLDALYFVMYGVFDPANPDQGRDDIAYIYSTFPIIERTETALYGSYRNRDLCLAWVNALSAGQPDAEVEG